MHACGIKTVGPTDLNYGSHQMERGLAPDPAGDGTWEGQLQPLTDPSSLTINQFVMVLLIALIEQMNNVCDVIKDRVINYIVRYIHHPYQYPGIAKIKEKWVFLERAGVVQILKNLEQTLPGSTV